jgi:hypothetical protein
MPVKILCVLTSKSETEIFKHGGTQSWRLAVDRARACKYVVLYRHDQHPDVVSGKSAQGSAFMVGSIKDVIPSTDGTSDRWLVTISEFAFCELEDSWDGRNPVAYWQEKDFKDWLNFQKLPFEAMPTISAAETMPMIGSKLTIAQAKIGLSNTFNVPIEAIEITIKG